VNGKRERFFQQRPQDRQRLAGSTVWPRDIPYSPRHLTISSPVITHDWAAIQQAYAASASTVDEICAQYKVSRTQLYAYARESGWDLRNASAMSEWRRRQARDKALAERLMQALDKKMTAFENRLADGHATPADSERDARTLNTLVRLFEKLRSIDEKALRPARPASAPASAAKDAIDADSLRHSLAQRLEKLRSGHGG
jgi:hypothetical protein